MRLGENIAKMGWNYPNPIYMYPRRKRRPQCAKCKYKIGNFCYQRKYSGYDSAELEGTTNRKCGHFEPKQGDPSLRRKEKQEINPPLEEYNNGGGILGIIFLGFIFLVFIFVFFIIGNQPESDITEIEQPKIESSKPQIKTQPTEPIDPLKSRFPYHTKRDGELCGPWSLAEEAWVDNLHFEAGTISKACLPIEDIDECVVEGMNIKPECLANAISKKTGRKVFVYRDYAKGWEEAEKLGLPGRSEDGDWT